MGFGSDHVLGGTAVRDFRAILLGSGTRHNGQTQGGVDYWTDSTIKGPLTDDVVNGKGDQPPGYSDVDPIYSSYTCAKTSISRVPITFM